MGSFLCVELGGFEFKCLSHAEKQRKICFTIYSCFKNSAICSTVDDDNSWKMRYPHVFGILLIIYKILDAQSWKLYAFVSCVFLSPGNSVEAHGATCFLFCPTLQGFQTVPQCARRECHSSKLTVRSVPALQSLGDSSCLYLGPLHFLGNSLERFPSWLLSPAPFFLGFESWCSSLLPLCDYFSARWFHHTWSPLLPSFQGSRSYSCTHSIWWPAQWQGWSPCLGGVAVRNDLARGSHVTLTLQCQSRSNSCRLAEFSLTLRKCLWLALSHSPGLEEGEEVELESSSEFWATYLLPAPFHNTFFALLGSSPLGVLPLALTLPLAPAPLLAWNFHPT